MDNTVEQKTILFDILKPGAELKAFILDEDKVKEMMKDVNEKTAKLLKSREIDYKQLEQRITI